MRSESNFRIDAIQFHMDWSTEIHSNVGYQTYECALDEIVLWIDGISCKYSCCHEIYFPQTSRENSILPWSDPPIPVSNSWCFRDFFFFFFDFSSSLKQHMFVTSTRTFFFFGKDALLLLSYDWTKTKECFNLLLFFF